MSLEFELRAAKFANLLRYSMGFAIAQAPHLTCKPETKNFDRINIVARRFLCAWIVAKHVNDSFPKFTYSRHLNGAIYTLAAASTLISLVRHYYISNNRTVDIPTLLARGTSSYYIAGYTPKLFMITLVATYFLSCTLNADFETQLPVILGVDIGLSVNTKTFKALLPTFMKENFNNASYFASIFTVFALFSASKFINYKLEASRITA